MFNANNYGYNPYGRYMPQQSMQQPTQQQMQPTQMSMQTANTLSGKQVDSLDVVKAIEYPLDGSTSYYPLTDGSCIATKQLQMDGTSKITIFKPVTEQKEENRYITHDDMKKALDKLDFSEIDDIKDELKDIKKELKELKKKKKDD